MATTPAPLSIEEYLKTQCRPDCDFVDGEIEERNVGERDHTSRRFYRREGGPSCGARTLRRYLFD